MERTIDTDEAARRMRVESELRRQQELNRLLLDNLVDGVVACDAESRLTTFNRAAREWHGADCLALAPEQWSRHYGLYEPDTVTPLATDAIPLLRAFRGETLRDVPMSIVRAGAAPRVVAASGGPVVDLDGRKLGAVVVMHDLTGLREKQAAEAASQAKSAFLATVSHEIRTPMNGVLGAMELLAATGLQGERADLLDTAQRSARSLLALLDDVLDMAKIEAGRIEVNEAPCSLRAVVAETLSTHLPVALARGIALSATVAPAVPGWVRADALRLRQILGNFVSNALKFTPRGGVEITLDAEPAGGARHRVVCAVRDSGVGIAPQDMEKLFQPFEQGAGELARNSGGTGLGLAICRGLAGRMGGTVALESAVGEGTTARLEVELEACEATAFPRAKTLQTRVSELAAVCRGGVCAAGALVVDDHPTNRRLLVSQLTRLGVEVETAADGMQALELLRSRSFGLVITDCEMPHMDGYALAQAIRRGEAGDAGVPIVACTAHALAEVAGRCRASGMDEVLIKPIALAQLAEMLRRYLARPAAPSEPVEVLDADEELLAEFVAEQGDLLPELAAAAADGDHDRCARLAHRAYGAARVVGAAALAERCARLEAAARAGAPASELATLCDEAMREQRRLEAGLGAPQEAS